MSITVSPVLSYHVADATASFCEQYTLMEEIGKGTYSTIFLAKNKQGDLVAIKQYKIEDQEVIDALEEQGENRDAYIKKLAEHELEIGNLTDHPNIVKIKEIWLESSTAYVVMDYVVGNTWNTTQDYSPEIRRALTQQFLSALEHLLLRNIIIDDLWSENILISHGSHLTLLDLGGYERIIDSRSSMRIGSSFRKLFTCFSRQPSGNSSELIQGAELPLEHYLSQIERMMRELLGEQEAQRVLSSCRSLLPNREKKILSSHVAALVSWVEALQKELSTSVPLTNTSHADSADGILAAHKEIQAQYPDHISFNTAQHVQFLAYSLVALHALKRFKPGHYPDSYLNNMHFLRYPFRDSPKSLENLFQRLPLRPNYDTASSLVADALIAASPSLQESESQESAWAIFQGNEREDDEGAEYLMRIFESEQVSSTHYRDRLEQLAEEAPQSDHGLIYNFFLPKGAPLSTVVYPSEPYGVPIGDPLSPKTVLDFYKDYESSSLQIKNPQLRFLPLALTPENGFPGDAAKCHRFTCISEEEFKVFSKKIEGLVDAIFADHLKEMFHLASFAAKVETMSDAVKKQKGYQTLCHRHLRRHDVQLALYYWHKIDDQNQNKLVFLPGILAVLIQQHQLEKANRYFQQYEERLPYKEEIIARFAILYMEEGNHLMLDRMIEKLSSSPLKQAVLILADERYPEYAQENVPEDELPSFMSDDELIELFANQ